MPRLDELVAQKLDGLRTARQERILDRVVNPYSTHRPSPKQRAFLDLDAEEALFGGSGGGGKTDTLILAALQYVDVPGYSAALFRRTKPDLNKPGSILDRAKTWFGGTPARWDEKLHGFRFPTRQGQPDATIHFGYAASLQEVIDRYQGSEFCFCGVDELTQWNENAYTYLFSRLRRLKGFPVPVRMRASSNPGGRGGDWVRARFVDFAKHTGTGMTAREYLATRMRGEALPEPPYFESPPSSEAVAIAKELGRRPQGAFFVPAFAQDNPGLDQEQYRLELSRLDPPTRAQLEHGDWWMLPGGKFFKEGDFKYLDESPAGLRTIRYWDLAGTKPKPGNKDPDWCAGVRLGVERLPDGARRVVITHARRFREDPGAVETEVKGTAESDGKRVAQHFEEEPGSAGKNNTHNYAARVLFGWQVHGHRKTGPKPEYWKALSSVARNGNLYLVRGEWNADFVAELCALTLDDSHAHDDQADAASGGLAMLLGDSDADRARMLATIS